MSTPNVYCQPLCGLARNWSVRKLHACLVSERRQTLKSGTLQLKTREEIANFHRPITVSQCKILIFERYLAFGSYPYIHKNCGIHVEYLAEYIHLIIGTAIAFVPILPYCQYPTGCRFFRQPIRTLLTYEHSARRSVHFPTPIKLCTFLLTFSVYSQNSSDGKR